MDETLPRQASVEPKPTNAAMDPLDRWLSGEAIQPKRLSDGQRAVLWMRKHPRVSRLAVVLLVAAVVMPIGSLAAYFRTAEALRQATVARDAVEQERLELSATVSRKVVELQSQADRWHSQQQEHERLKNELHQLQTNYELCQQQCRVADQRLHDALREARLSLAEQFSLQAQEVQRSQPGTSLLLAAKALSITQQEGVPPIPTALQQVHDLLAPTDGIELRGHEGPVTLLAASRDGHWIASGDHQGMIRLWPITPGSTFDSPKLLDGHWDRITQLGFTADNRWLISGSADSTVHLWSLKAADPAGVPILLRIKQGRFGSLAVSGDGRWLAIASTAHLTDDSSVRLWDLHADDVHASAVDLPTYQGQVSSLAVSRDGEWAAAGNDDGSVRLWRFSNPSHALASTTLRVHGLPVRAVSFSPDGRSLITAACSKGGTGGVRAWSLTDTDPSADLVLDGDAAEADRFAITEDGRWLVTASEEPSLRVRDLTALDQQESDTRLTGLTGPVQAMALSANGRWLAAAGTDNAVCLWYVGSAGPVATPVTIRAARGQVTGIALIGQGDWLATGNDQGIIQLWNLQVDDLIRLANARMLQ